MTVIRLGFLESNFIVLITIEALNLKYLFHSLRMVRREDFYHSEGLFTNGGLDRD
ncbi:MAG: hypothetical protein ACTSQE_04285 [Candidatus Heimdallarchaeaceae archaeon]